MDYYTLTTADRLERQRAAELARDVERRRRVADRGTTVAPARPVVDQIRDLGIWLRRAHRVPRTPIASGFVH